MIDLLCVINGKAMILAQSLGLRAEWNRGDKGPSAPACCRLESLRTCTRGDDAASNLDDLQQKVFELSKNIRHRFRHVACFDIGQSSVNSHDPGRRTSKANAMLLW